MDHHTLAIISISGSCLDCLGGLYLAYDLLGGKHGPLRTLTRGVTYTLLYGIGYGIPLGPAVGIAAGLAHGITLGIEYSRASKHLEHRGIGFDFAVSTLRALGYAVGTYFLLGIRFATVFGGLSAVGQTVAYRFGIRPELDYGPRMRPRLTKRQFLAALNRTLGYAVAGWVSAVTAAQAHPLGLGFRTGIAIGAVTAIVGSLTPFIEWMAETLPDRRLGTLGIGLILFGFVLQSVQYWMALFDVPIH